MAQAMISGIIRSDIVENRQICGYDVSESVLEKVKREYRITTALSNIEIAKQCDVIVLAVKPQFYQAVIQEIADELTDDALIISIAPGKTLQVLQEYFQREIHIIRAMPNTPALIGEGMTAICASKRVSKEEIAKARRILETLGRVEEVDESIMDAVVAVSGSSPAYVYMMLEAMADAAVYKGMPRQMAYTFAAQAIMGSAKMFLDLQKHPGEWKDMVTSPSGTTIEAVRVLEREGFRSALIEAMIACAEKSSRM